MGALGEQAVHDPVELGKPRRGAEGGDEGNRRVGQAPAQGAHRPQRRGVGPVEVLQTQGHRALGGQLLEEVDDRLDDPEADVAPARLGQLGTPRQRLLVAGHQSADLGPLPVGGVGVEGQGLGQGSKGTAPLQLLGRPVEDEEA